MAATLDIRINRGLPYRAVLTFYADVELTTTIDITGWTFVTQVKKDPGDRLLATGSVTITDAANGVAQVDYSAAATAEIPDGCAKWDLIGTDTEDFSRLLVEGEVTVKSTNSQLA